MKTKYLKISIAIISVFALILSFTGCSREDYKDPAPEDNKVIFSQTDKKLVAVQYPFEESEVQTAVATMKNLESGEIITDDTFDIKFHTFTFLFEENGKYLITVLNSDKVLSEHTVEITDENSYYHIRMQND